MAEGDRVTVLGTMATSVGERRVLASTVTIGARGAAGATWVRVLTGLAPGLTTAPPPQGAFVRVTGISSVLRTAEGLRPMVVPRRDADVSVVGED